MGRSVSAMKSMTTSTTRRSPKPAAIQHTLQARLHANPSNVRRSVGASERSTHRRCACLGFGSEGLAATTRHPRKNPAFTASNSRRRPSQCSLSLQADRAVTQSDLRIVASERISPSGLETPLMRRARRFHGRRSGPRLSPRTTRRTEWSKRAPSWSKRWPTSFATRTPTSR